MRRHRKVSPTHPSCGNPFTKASSSTTMSSRHVFVFGITGTQGKAVALAMRQGGWQVTGLTRNKDGQVALGE